MEPLSCHLGFDILTAMVIISSIFWDIIFCSPLKVNIRFGGTCVLHVQGLGIGQAGHYRESRCQEGTHGLCGVKSQNIKLPYLFNNPFSGSSLIQLARTFPE
jgi:hypothetical protein